MRAESSGEIIVRTGVVFQAGVSNIAQPPISIWLHTDTCNSTPQPDILHASHLRDSLSVHCACNFTTRSLNTTSLTRAFSPEAHYHETGPSVSLPRPLTLAISHPAARDAIRSSLVVSADLGSSSRNPRITSALHSAASGGSPNW
ncbi:hypothetical protein E2C01_023155 [Portunus trituberculatus]|uniref:Uncharacterized protein n=1 Tax=Portunus trituberculatus TaxID=210409 RepID=A0A5B7EAE5_PORTR|nr:hypothetical protein [Portunus trituberculatus]